VKRGEPRFPGHQQPKVSAWGYEDESDPAVFAGKIDAAADHGITHFIFDWYHYEDGPFLSKCLDQGYLGAANNNRLGFCLMWANHTWVDIHPAKANQPAGVLYPGEVSPGAFDRIGDEIIERYFARLPRITGRRPVSAPPMPMVHSAPARIPVADWFAGIAGPTIADAIVDRLGHGAHRIDMTGESMRKKLADLTAEPA